VTGSALQLCGAAPAAGGVHEGACVWFMRRMQIPAQMRLPPVMEQQSMQPQFFLGAAGTGAPVHFHGDAWNAIAFGAKRWCVALIRCVGVFWRGC
jgi:hypothetical protein